MNQQAPNGQGSDNTNQPNGNNGNPKWLSLLEGIPEALQPLVKNAFTQWDAQVTQRFQELHQQYAPLKAYEPLVQQNIPVQRVAEALQFAQELEKDPKAMALRMNETFGLGLAEQSQQQNQNNNADDFDYGNEFGNADISQHPMFKQMQQTLDSLQQNQTAQQQQREQEEETERFYEYLDQLTESKAHLKDNDDAKLILANFIAGGMDAQQALGKVDAIFVGQTVNTLEQTLETATNNGEQSNVTDPIRAAVENNLGTLNGQQDNSEQAPVVMGGAGTVGSGTPTSAIDFAGMSQKDMNSLVLQALQADSNNS